MNTTLKSTFTSEQRKAFKPRIVKRNTFEFFNGDDRVIRLHNTDIVTFKPNGKIILNSEGYKTVTTKDRMNDVLNQKGFSIYQLKGIWYVSHRQEALYKVNSVPYYDGIVIPDCFKDDKLVKKANKVEKQELKLRKDILNFSKLITKDNIPVPSSGDCWYCCLRTDDNQYLGQATGNTDHLLQHIKEGYMHGSLIYNACKFVGYREPQFIMRLGNVTSLRSAVKRYLYAQLGLVK